MSRQKNIHCVGRGSAIPFLSFRTHLSPDRRARKRGRIVSDTRAAEAPDLRPRRLGTIKAGKRDTNPSAIFWVFVRWYYELWTHKQFQLKYRKQGELTSNPVPAAQALEAYSVCCILILEAERTARSYLYLSTCRQAKEVAAGRTVDSCVQEGKKNSRYFGRMAAWVGVSRYKETAAV